MRIHIADANAGDGLAGIFVGCLRNGYGDAGRIVDASDVDGFRHSAGTACAACALSTTVTVAKSPVSQKIAKGIAGGVIAGVALPLAISQITSTKIGKVQ